jgi:hypothetical protein
MFRGYFIYGDFFSGLHQTKQQSVFKKGSQTYSTFPDRVILDVDAVTYRCSNPGDRPSVGAGLMDNLTFRVSRKVGSDNTRQETQGVEEKSYTRINFDLGKTIVFFLNAATIFPFSELNCFPGDSDEVDQHSAPMPISVPG